MQPKSYGPSFTVRGLQPRGQWHLKSATLQHPHPHSLNSGGPPDRWRAVLGQLIVIAFIDSPGPWRLSEDHTPRRWNCCHSRHRLSAQMVSMRQKANQHLPVLSREIDTRIFLFVLVPLKLWWCRRGVCSGPSNRQYLVYVNFSLKQPNKSDMHRVCPCKKHLLYCSWILYRKSSLLT